MFLVFVFLLQTNDSNLLCMNVYVCVFFFSTFISHLLIINVFLILSTSSLVLYYYYHVLALGVANYYSSPSADSNPLGEKNVHSVSPT